MRQEVREACVSVWQSEGSRGKKEISKRQVMEKWRQGEVNGWEGNKGKVGTVGKPSETGRKGYTGEGQKREGKQLQEKEARRKVG